MTDIDGGLNSHNSHNSTARVEHRDERIEQSLRTNPPPRRGSPSALAAAPADAILEVSARRAGLFLFHDDALITPCNLPRFLTTEDDHEVLREGGPKSPPGLEHDPNDAGVGQALAHLVDGASVNPSTPDERRLAKALAFAIREAARLRRQQAGTLRVIEGKHGGPDGSTEIA